MCSSLTRHEVAEKTMTETKAIDRFTKAIYHNCEISDAQGASIFSICGMALRLRDLNKWEKDLFPWQENNPSELIDWIDKKEQKWEKMGGQEFIPLPFFDQNFDPFDTLTINKAIAPFGLFYGAGYAHALKPTFFLAQIQETKQVNGVMVRVLKKELMRDLLTIPALNQDGEVVLRQDAARLFLWDQMAYLKKSGQRFLKFALRHSGLPDAGLESRKSHFDAILAIQRWTYIHHEIGELKDKVFHHKAFGQIISEFPQTPVELLARTVKDLLADTGPQGTLAHIISTGNVAALGFYAAFQDGLFRPLFPQLRKAVETYISVNDWDIIERAREQGFDTACQYANDLIGMFNQKKDNDTISKLAEEINQKLVQPLIVQ